MNQKRFKTTDARTYKFCMKLFHVLTRYEQNMEIWVQLSGTENVTTNFETVGSLTADISC